MSINKIKHNKEILIDELESWPKTKHVFDEESIWAIRAALASGRPLLVRGEPGTGKSQLARAAAHVLDRAFVYEVVNAKSEASDLQYSFDAVARLGEAQLMAGVCHSNDASANLRHEKFLSPGMLWWAFDWQSAEKQYEVSNKSLRRPCVSQQNKAKNGVVLLIDEIDKADTDLPNGLLETLGNGSFTIPYIGEPIKNFNKDNKPLVIITTNEERELPNAFLRRCLVLNLELPDTDEALLEWLSERGRVHFGNKCSKEVREQAAEQLIADRKIAIQESHSAPGQAEYIDLLRALINIGSNKEEQLNALAKIRNFVLRKHSEK